MECVLPPAFFGPIAYFSYLVSHGEATIDVHSHFIKQTVRSRAEILGSNGPLRLIVPLEKWGNRTAMKDVRIDNSSNWPVLHLRSIRSAYANSPFFEHYSHHFEKLYSETHESLVELDIRSTRLILELLQIETTLELSEDFIPGSEDMKEDFRSMFDRNGTYKNSTLPSYQQVFSDRFSFVPNLSILDLLFNTGPRSAVYLSELVKK